MGSETLGLIMSFIGVGSLLASLYIASRKEILSLGKIQFIGILVCGLIVMPFFFVESLIITILLSIILGFTMVCAIASTNTILQALTHNEMKGRIMGYYLMFFTLGASFGNLFFGYLADILSLPYSMLISGALTIIGLRSVEGRIQPIWLSGRMKRLIEESNPADLRVFPGNGG